MDESIHLWERLSPEEDEALQKKLADYAGAADKLHALVGDSDPNEVNWTHELPEAGELLDTMSNILADIAVLALDYARPDIVAGLKDELRTHPTWGWERLAVDNVLEEDLNFHRKIVDAAARLYQELSLG